MPATMDTTDGQTAFVSAREDAWHKLGTTLEDSFTAEQAMEQGLLGGWNVRKQPIWVQDERTGAYLPVPQRNAVVRDNPVNGRLDVLGDVGDSYRVIQNEDHAEFLNDLVDESGAHFETAGALDGGRQVFITMKLPGHMKIGGADQVDNYIAAVNSHDGSKAFTLMVTPIRIVCQNTLNIALKSAQRQFRIRHTSGASSHILGQARQALDLTFNYLEDFQEQADRLINTTMTQSRFEQIIEQEFGAPEDSSPNTVTRCQNKIDELAELFSDSYTHEGVRETAWAGFGALTEWNDHFAPTRGSDRDNSRAQKAVLDPGFKDRAFQLMLAG